MSSLWGRSLWQIDIKDRFIWPYSLTGPNFIEKIKAGTGERSRSVEYSEKRGPNAGAR